MWQPIKFGHWLPSSLCFSCSTTGQRISQTTCKTATNKVPRSCYQHLQNTYTRTCSCWSWLLSLQSLSTWCFSKTWAPTVHKRPSHENWPSNDFWWPLGNNYWNFLNFDLLEHLVSIFGSEELKQKMESYKHDLQSFRKATRLCDFISCWPVRGQTPPKKELRKFVAKMKHDWDNCTLEDLETLRGVITRKFFIPGFAFWLRKIKKGCIAITWLVPAPLVKTLQETIKTTSSDFFLEHKIETITIDRNVCYPSSRKHVDLTKEQFTSQSTGEAQREKSPLGILLKKLHSIESVTSEKQPFPKELHRMRLAEEILSGDSTSMVPSEDIQLSIHPGDIQGEKSTPSFLSKHRQKFSIRPQMPSSYPSSYTSRVPSSFDTPTLEEMEAITNAKASHPPRW